METKKNGTVLNVLVVDEMVAHFALLKSNYPQEEDKQVHFFSKFKLEDLSDFIDHREIKLVIFFVYGRRSLHKLLPFLGFDLEIILFTNERDLWWLSESLPQVNVVDLALPKAQLLNVVEDVIQGLRTKDE